MNSKNLFRQISLSVFVALSLTHCAGGNDGDSTQLFNNSTGDEKVMQDRAISSEIFVKDLLHICRDGVLSEEQYFKLPDNSFAKVTDESIKAEVAALNLGIYILEKVPVKEQEGDDEEASEECRNRIASRLELTVQVSHDNGQGMGNAADGIMFKSALVGVEEGSALEPTRIKALINRGWVPVNKAESLGQDGNDEVNSVGLAVE